MAKGSSYERDLSKKLSLWISDGEDDSWCWRTASSGGRATIRAKTNRKTSGAAGDIRATDPRAEWFFKLFSVEAKKGYASATIDSMIDSKQKVPMIVQFWEQACGSCNISDSLYPVVILAKDNRKELAIFDSSFVFTLTRLFGKLSFPHFKYRSEEYYLCICTLKDLLAFMDVKTLREEVESAA